MSALLQYLWHKTGQIGNLQLGNHNFKVNWLFDYVVTWQIKKLISALSQYPWLRTWQSGNLGLDNENH